MTIAVSCERSASCNSVILSLFSEQRAVDSNLDAYWTRRRRRTMMRSWDVCVRWKTQPAPGCVRACACIFDGGHRGFIVFQLKSKREEIAVSVDERAGEIRERIRRYRSSRCAPATHSLIAIQSGILTRRNIAGAIHTLLCALLSSLYYLLIKYSFLSARNNRPLSARPRIA